MNEIKFTLSASSSSEPGVEIPTQTPDYIKEIASKRKLNSLLFSANSVDCKLESLIRIQLQVLEDF